MVEKPRVLDKRQIRLEDVMKKDYIPFLGGRPERESIIGQEDITNLQINLNVTRSVDEFIKAI